MLLAQSFSGELSSLLARFRLRLCWIAAGLDIPGSYWGECEAGLLGDRLYARADTPLHSALHEAAHYICMTPDRRRCLHTDAGGDDDEESAVCYLQLRLATTLDADLPARLMADMDAWGYSFRLGSTARWYASDAANAKDLLRQWGLIDRAEYPLYRLRTDGSAHSRAKSSPRLAKSAY